MQFPFEFREPIRGGVLRGWVLRHDLCRLDPDKALSSEGCDASATLLCIDGTIQHRGDRSHEGHLEVIIFGATLEHVGARTPSATMIISLRA